MADDDRGQVPAGEQLGNVPSGLALARAGPAGADRDHRPGALDHGPLRSKDREVGPGGQRSRSGVHDGLVGDVAVGEHDRLDPFVADHPLELLLGEDRDPGRMELARQLGRIAPSGDARDLGRGEGHDLDGRIVPVGDVEVVEVAPGGAHDQDSPSAHDGLLCRSTPGRHSQPGVAIAIH